MPLLRSERAGHTAVVETRLEILWSSVCIFSPIVFGKKWQELLETTISGFLLEPFSQKRKRRRTLI